MDFEHAEDLFGPRIDSAVSKLDGLVPVEQSLELRTVVRNLVHEAVEVGWASSLMLDDDHVGVQA